MDALGTGVFNKSLKRLFIYPVVIFMTLAFYACADDKRVNADTSREAIHELVPFDGEDSPGGVNLQDTSEAHNADLMQHSLRETGYVVTVPLQPSNTGLSIEPWKRSNIVVEASSELPYKARTYSADMAIDHQPHTAWVEGAKGHGVGEWLSFSFQSPFSDVAQLMAEEDALGNSQDVPGDAFVWRPRPVGLMIIPGYAKSPERFRQNGRPKTVLAEMSYFDGQGVEHTSRYRLHLEDMQRPQIFEFDNFSDDLVIFGRCSLKLTIMEVYPGELYEDTCISEVRLIFSDGI